MQALKSEPALNSILENSNGPESIQQEKKESDTKELENNENSEKFGIPSTQRLPPSVKSETTRIRMRLKINHRWKIKIFLRLELFDLKVGW